MRMVVVHRYLPAASHLLFLIPLLDAYLVFNLCDVQSGLIETRTSFVFFSRANHWLLVSLGYLGFVAASGVRRLAIR